MLVHSLLLTPPNSTQHFTHPTIQSCNLLDDSVDPIIVIITRWLSRGECEVMELGGPTTMMTRLVGDYILGPRIGSGSFAVVWRSRHRHSGLEVAVKEIDKTQLSPKVRDNLIKEVSILSTIHHPNIIRLFEAFQVCLH